MPALPHWVEHLCDGTTATTHHPLHPEPTQTICPLTLTMDAVIHSELQWQSRTEFSPLSEEWYLSWICTASCSANSGIGEKAGWEHLKLFLLPKPSLLSYQLHVQSTLTNWRESERSLAHGTYTTETAASPGTRTSQI